MVDSGTQLGVDLNELYRSAHYLDKVGDDFASASGLVSKNAAPKQSGPWQTSAPNWTSLQQAVSAMLTTSANNLHDSASTLNKTMQSYANSDHDATTKLKSLEQQDVNEQGW